MEGVPLGADPRYPHRGHEDDYVSYGVCVGACNRFENVRMRIGLGPGHIDPDLVAAIIRKEQVYYKQFFDTGTDNYVREHGNLDALPGKDTSIGPAQMQIRNIENLMKEFPEQLEPYLLSIRMKNRSKISTAS